MSVLMAVIVIEPVRASVMARVPYDVATGVAGQPAFVIDLYRGVGFDVSLLRCQVQISDWWVDDPSRVVARPDRTAQVLHLRLIRLAAILPSNRTWTTLKLLVKDARGQTSLLHFVVRFQERPDIRQDQVRFHGVEVLPAMSLPSPITPLQ